MHVPARSLAGVALVGLLAGCASPGSSGGLPKGTVDVSASHCGQGWTRPHAGQQTLAVHNSGDTSAEAYLVDTATGRVHGEVEYLAPATTGAMTVTIGGGTFAMRYITDNGAGPIMGPAVRVAGAARPGTGVLPVTKADLYGPVAGYQRYVTGGLVVLAGRTATLKHDVDSGDLASARRDWLPAHLAYEVLGAAYGTFDDFDQKINGLPGRVSGDRLTGFHRVERGLWHGEPAASLKAPADQLYSDVLALRKDFPSRQMDPAQMPLRAHEILENTLQFQLTGEADAGSGTELATAEANLRGTREVVNLLRPVLTTRYAGLPAVDQAMDLLEALLTAQDHGGVWTSLDRLPSIDRERIDGAMGALLEKLAPVAAIGVARRTTS
jgi:iron uptake system EfeUOB component EfeO/EfeM